MYSPLSVYYYILPIDIENYINAIAEAEDMPEDYREVYSDKGEAYFRIGISQAEGDNFNKIIAIIYGA